MNSSIPFRSINYKWETFLYSPKIEPKKSFENKFGYRVLSRNDDLADKVQFNVYTKTKQDIYIIGTFNEWGKKDLEKYKLEFDEKGFSFIVLDNIHHKDSYLYLMGEKFLRDPATILFDDKGNSIFWDFDDPSTYKLKHSKPERLHRATKILQTDIAGLVSKWFEYDQNAKTLAQSKDDLFTYICECGVLDKIKDLGFNTLQFLPITQSIDGDNWKHRYLVTYPFAIQKNFGTPDSFLRLIDKCHELGISVILDLILSHCPYKDFKLFNFEGADVGLNSWKDCFEKDLFLDEKTSWGTKRYRYTDDHIRQYLIESGLLFLTKYGIDGFRIDNVDGILRFNDNGDGEERPGGRKLMQKLSEEFYFHDPYCLIHLEAHYFYGDNAKLLVCTKNLSNAALEATAYNSSRLTYFLHSEYMLKAAHELSIWPIEHIRKEKEWGNSNSTIGDFHNHDAAAGLMYGRATGSYAFDAMTLGKPELEKHAIGKIQVMESLISFGLEGRTLDLLQTFLLQKGSFEHDCAIDWKKLNEEKSKEVVYFKKQVNSLLNNPAFWPENTINREYMNVDDENKVLVILRKDTTQNTNKEHYIIINFAGKRLENYKFGLEKEGKLNLILSSFNNEKNKSINITESHNFELFTKEAKIPEINEYGILIYILEE
jgi:1,4-alpha-glucan branching enzyme